MEDTENTKLIEELMKDAEKAEEPGGADSSRLIHAGDDEMPAPMVRTKLESAGYVYVWDTRTGERSVVNRNMLPKQLEKTREDGSRVFTTMRPKQKPKRGNLKCLLHPDSPNRKHYDELGLAVCRKSNLTNPYQVKRHMEKRHKAEWATLEQERITKERDDERLFQRTILEGMGKDKNSPQKGEFVCDVCGESFNKAIALTGHKRKHK